MTGPPALGRAAKLRPRDAPEFAQTAARSQGLVGKQTQARGHGQGEMARAGQEQQSEPHGRLRSKLAADAQERRGRELDVRFQGSAASTSPSQESLCEDPVQVTKTSFSS